MLKPSSTCRAPELVLWLTASLLLAMFTLVLPASHAASKGETLVPFPYSDEARLPEAIEFSKNNMSPSQKMTYGMAQKPSPSALAKKPSPAASPSVETSPIHLPKVKTREESWLKQKLKKIFHISSNEAPRPQSHDYPKIVEEIGSHTPPLAGSAVELEPANDELQDVIQAASIRGGEAPIAMAVMSRSEPMMAPGIEVPRPWFGRRPQPSYRESHLIRMIQHTNPAWDDESAHRLSRLIVESSDKHRIDYRILASLVATESSFKLDAVSRTGAKGLGQLKDATAEWLGVQNSFDPVDNLNGTAKYLSYLADTFPGDPARAIASYFVGQGTVKREGLNEGAIRYIMKVQRHLDILLGWGAE